MLREYLYTSSLNKCRKCRFTHFCHKMSKMLAYEHLGKSFLASVKSLTNMMSAATSTWVQKAEGREGFQVRPSSSNWLPSSLVGPHTALWSSFQLLARGDNQLHTQAPLFPPFFPAIYGSRSNRIVDNLSLLWDGNELIRHDISTAPGNFWRQTQPFLYQFSQSPSIFFGLFFL